jgi:hypothetical protein
MRILHLLVIGFLVFAAAYVYRIKLESTVRTERVLRLHADIREQRDAIAGLRSEWSKLDAPSRLQGLVERHLPLKPVTAVQYDTLKNLPERPPNLVKPGTPDPIGAMIDAVAAKASDKAGDKSGDKSADPAVTGSVSPPAAEPTEPEDAQ